MKLLFLLAVIGFAAYVVALPVEQQDAEDDFLTVEEADALADVLEDLEDGTVYGFGKKLRKGLKKVGRAIEKGIKKGLKHGLKFNTSFYNSADKSQAHDAIARVPVTIFVNDEKTDLTLDELYEFLIFTSTLDVDTDVDNSLYGFNDFVKRLRGFNRQLKSFTNAFKIREIVIKIKFGR